MIAALAELSRIPFDMPIAESELVMGYLTEYSGFRFLFFFLAEFASMFTLSAIAVTLFLGGYWLPGVPEFPLEFAGPVILMAKVFLLVFAMIWFRWTFPRFREDQLAEPRLEMADPARVGQHRYHRSVQGVPLMTDTARKLPGGGMVKGLWVTLSTMFKTIFLPKSHLATVNYPKVKETRCRGRAA